MNLKINLQIEMVQIHREIPAYNIKKIPGKYRGSLRTDLTQMH